MTHIPATERMVLTVEETALELKVSRAQMYALIRRGTVPSVKVGNSVRVPRRALEAWLDEQMRRGA